MGDGGIDSRVWTREWELLTRELRAARRRFAVLVDVVQDSTTALLGMRVDQVVSVGEVATTVNEPELLASTIPLHGASVLLVDTEVLFSPELELDPIELFRQLSNHRALFVLWPGRFASGRLIYSRPGRGDYFDQAARDLLILRPTESVFPDEAPFELEYYPE